MNHRKSWIVTGKDFTKLKREKNRRMMEQANRHGADEISKSRNGVLTISFSDVHKADEFLAFLHRNPPSAFGRSEIRGKHVFHVNVL